MPDRTFEIIVATSQGPSGPFFNAKTKFVDELDQDQIFRLGQIDAELLNILAASTLDEGRALDLISAALVIVGEQPL